MHACMHEISSSSVVHNELVVRVDPPGRQWLLLSWDSHKYSSIRESSVVGLGPSNLVSRELASERERERDHA
jgi:hypothetical protein